jgi:hypothetical protein
LSVGLLVSLQLFEEPVAPGDGVTDAHDAESQRGVLGEGWRARITQLSGVRSELELLVVVCGKPIDEARTLLGDEGALAQEI